MLIQIIQNLVQAKSANDEARERWQDLIAEGGDQAAEALRDYREKQSLFEKSTDELVSQISELKQAGELADEIESLAGETLDAFNRLVAELGLAELVAPSTPENLESLLTAWFSAGATLDAAVRLNDERLGFEVEDASRLVESFDSHIEVCHGRDERGWKRAVKMYRAILAELAAQESDDAWSRMADATHEVIRKARREDDRLLELVRDTVASFISQGQMRFELAELPDRLRHRLQRIMDAGLLPQPQLQTETKPEPRPVAVLETVESDLTETDTEFDTDIELDAGVADQVEAWLRSLNN